MFGDPVYIPYFLQKFRNYSRQVTQVKPPRGYSKMTGCCQCNDMSHRLNKCPVVGTFFRGRNNRSILPIQASLHFEEFTPGESKFRETILNILTSNIRAAKMTSAVLALACTTKWSLLMKLPYSLWHAKRRTSYICCVRVWVEIGRKKSVTPIGCVDAAVRTRGPVEIGHFFEACAPVMLLIVVH